MGLILATAVAITLISEIVVSDSSIMAILTLSWGEWYFWMILKTALLLAFPLLLWLVGFHTDEERQKLKYFAGQLGLAGQAGNRQ